jgi:DNA-binding NarL/FixJ family response regulator
VKTTKPLRGEHSGAVRILLVDDHPIVREGLAEMINRQPGLRVCGEAEDREQALAAVETCKPDLAIVDLALNGQPGIELIKDLRACHPNLRVLVLSMLDEQVHAERVIRAGACGYIAKQEAAARILSAIQRVLDGGIYLSDAVTVQIAAKLACRPCGAVIENLADREFEVFELIGEGLSTQQIAERLHLGIGTIETYRARIKEKLGLKDAQELLQSAIRWNRTQALSQHMGRPLWVGLQPPDRKASDDVSRL